MDRKIPHLMPLIFIIILATPLSFAVETGSPIAVSRLVIGINQSGEIIAHGDVRNIRLMLYLPENRKETISSSPMETVVDGYGNEYAVLDLGNGGKYWIYSIVESRSKTVGKWRPVVDYGSKWTEGSKKAWVSENVEAFASSYNSSMESIARMVSDINSMVKYDPSVYEYNMDADWVIRNKRGSCDEYTNLLIASLRYLGIPARGVVGYAYSSPSDNTIRAHSWVEFLSDHGWIEADPTWNELGYIDGSHIRVGSFPDSYVEEKVEYSGTGNVEWKRFNETFEIIEKEVRPPVRIDAEVRDGYIEVSATADGCVMHRPLMSECVSNGKPVLEWKSYSEYICNYGKEYVFYRPLLGSGICPVEIYDEFGNNVPMDLKMRVSRGPEIISPDVVSGGYASISTSPPSVFYANGIGFGSGVVKFTRPGTNIVSAANGTSSWKEIRVVPGNVGIYAEVYPMEKGKKYNISVTVISDRRRSGLLSAVSGTEWSMVVNVSKGFNRFAVPVTASDSLVVSFSSDITASARYEIPLKSGFIGSMAEKLLSIVSWIYSAIQSVAAEIIS